MTKDIRCEACKGYRQKPLPIKGSILWATLLLVLWGGGAKQDSLVIRLSHKEAVEGRGRGRKF